MGFFCFVFKVSRVQGKKAWDGVHARNKFSVRCHGPLHIICTAAGTSQCAHDRSAPFRMEERKKKTTAAAEHLIGCRPWPSLDDLGCLFCQRTHSSFNEPFNEPSHCPLGLCAL